MQTLEVLLNTLTPSHSVKGDEHLRASNVIVNSRLFTAEKENTTLLIELLQDPDFYVRCDAARCAATRRDL
jgi:hypothetical protein